MTNQLSANEYEQVVQWVDRCKTTLWNCVHAFPLQFEFDDLYQDAFLLAVERYHVAITYNVPWLYIRKCLYYRLKDLWIVRRNYPLCISIDDESEDLIETLAEPEQGRSEETQAEMDQRIQALHSALRRLPLDAQKHLRRVYELNSYEPVPLYPYNLNRPLTTSSHCSQFAFHRLRHDTTLAQQLYG